MPNATHSVDQASASIVCGTLTSTGTAVDNVTLPDTPCRAVKLMAPTLGTPGARVNTSPVYFGTTASPNDLIDTTDCGKSGQYVQVQNANMIHLKFGTSGDKLEYRIET